MLKKKRCRPGSHSHILAFFLPFLALTLLGLPSLAHAEPRTLDVGALLGGSFSTGVSQFTFGAEADYEVSAPWSVGGTFTYFSPGSGVANYSSSYTTLAARGLFSLRSVLSGFYVGAQAGLWFFSTNVPTASASSVSLIIGPTVGYDYNIISQVSVGAEGTLYFSTASANSTLVQILGTVKYWF